MKVRNGFVSNSSSSSFVLRIMDSYDNFISNVVNSEELEYANYVNRFIENCEEIKKGFENSSNPIDFIEQWQYSRDKDTVDAYNEYLETKDILKLLKVKLGINVQDCGDNIKISGSTAMHNSYDDVPDFIKHMVVYYMCDHPEIKLTMERFGD